MVWNARCVSRSGPCLGGRELFESIGNPAFERTATKRLPPGPLTSSLEQVDEMRRGEIDPPHDLFVGRRRKGRTGGAGPNRPSTTTTGGRCSTALRFAACSRLVIGGRRRGSTMKRPISSSVTTNGGQKRTASPTPRMMMPRSIIS
ncbi:MAG: hypothetical protein R2710_10985 [Acidimicrobiales bacterium]